MERLANFSSGIQAAVLHTSKRVRYIVSMVVVGFWPRKPTDKFKIRYNNNNNNNMIVATTTAAVIAKRRRGFRCHRRRYIMVSFSVKCRLFVFFCVALRFV